MGQNATPGAGKQSSDVQIRQNSRHARKKNQMKSKLGMRLSQAQGNNITVSYRGENVQEIPSVAGQTTGAKYFRKKTLTNGKNCGNLIQVGLTCALD